MAIGAAGVASVADTKAAAKVTVAKATVAQVAEAVAKERVACAVTASA